MDETLRLALPAYLLIFFAIAFVLPSWRVWRLTGRNPVTFAGGDDAHDYVGRLFKALMVALAALLVGRALMPGLDRWLVPVWWLEGSAIRLAGGGLLLAALAWVVAAQRQMGLAWRIGIDRGAATPLVTGGLFARSRNPIFLGLHGALFGLLLVLPNLATLLAALLGAVAMAVQVRLEEAHLAALHGEAYRRYRAAAPRWL
ncbi:MAG TPA: methyltransferase [Alphaproteobacteria bacterium]|nr:methyltransferase [Alphaproteobacteria bacterium]